MKTFKDIFTSQKFYEKALHENYISETTLDFLVNSYNLQSIKHFIVPQIRKHIINITLSRKNNTEILVRFVSYPACLEFNKFYARQLLNTFHTNKQLKNKINLDKYKSIKGYVSKEKLKVYSFEEVRHVDVKEIAMGSFINHATNPKIRQIFEDIREIIKLNHKHIKQLDTQDFIVKPSSYNIADKPKYN